MKTKYDIGDEVLIKTKVNMIMVDSNEDVKYVLDIPHVATFIKFNENEIEGIAKQKEK